MSANSDNWSRKSRLPTRKRGPRFTRRTRARVQRQFLEAYAECGVVLVACRQVGLARQTIAYWEENNVDGFAIQYRRTKREVHDVVRAEMWRRALHGVERRKESQRTYVTPNGMRSERTVEVFREYSDAILLLMARNLPEYQWNRYPAGWTFNHITYHWEPPTKAIPDVPDQGIEDTLQDFDWQKFQTELDCHLNGQLPDPDQGSLQED